MRSRLQVRLLSQKFHGTADAAKTEFPRGRMKKPWFATRLRPRLQSTMVSILKRKISGLSETTTLRIQFFTPRAIVEIRKESSTGTCLVLFVKKLQSRLRRNGKSTIAVFLVQTQPLLCLKTW